MSEYLPLGAFRQGLLPDECRTCSWWQTTGTTVEQNDTAMQTRHEWVSALEDDWGCVGLLVYEPTGRNSARGTSEIVISASIHFAPSSSVARFRELPFPPLPPSSALLFCLQAQGDDPRPVAKRIIRKALYELRSRGVQEVYAIARSGEDSADAGDCRFLPAELLAASGFEQVSQNGDLRLMRVDNRGLISLLQQVETAVRRVFANEKEPAPSPAAWLRGRNGVEQGTP